MSQVVPIILVFAGLLTGVLLHPLSKLLAASSLGELFNGFLQFILYPFVVLGQLIRGLGKHLYLRKDKNPTLQRDNVHDDQIKTSAQLLRKILVSLAVVIQRADQAASDSNQTLGDVRNTIGRMDLPNDLKKVHMNLMREIDRMISGNSSLKQALSRSQDDLASQRRQIEELRTAVRMDGLTQLANRIYFDEKLLEMVKIQHRHNDMFSVLLVDVDNFKQVNDKYGHQAGDRILKGVAFNLRSSLRDSDFVARFGGDEFAIILFRSDGKSAVDVALKLCRSQEANRLLLDGVNINVTLSIGVAEVNGDDTPETLLKRADKALYCVKSEGRNGVRYQPSDISN